MTSVDTVHLVFKTHLDVGFTDFARRVVCCDVAGGCLWIESLDAPLVAPGAPGLLQFDNDPPDLRGGTHFNLFNNTWGTNFPMWCEDDGRFRFSFSLKPFRVKCKE